MKKTKILITVIIVLTAFACRDKIHNESGGDEDEQLVSSEKDSADKEVVELQVVKIQDCNQSFDSFFERFSHDSAFQKSRVIYPLKLLYYEDVLVDSLSVKIIEKASYNYIDLRNSNSVIGNEFEISFEGNDTQMNCFLIGIDSGFMVNYKFDLINGCWYLVKVLDEST